MNDRPTIIPATYPALEQEMYRSLETANERPTEPPPAPPTVIWDLIKAASRRTLVPLPWGRL